MKEILKDEIFEKGMKQRLLEAQQLAQNVLNEWIKLSFDPCTGSAALYEIIWSPEIPYQEGCNRLTLADGVSGELAAKHAANIQLPAPDSLYHACELARRNIYLQRELSLFDTKKGKVYLVESMAEPLIKQKSVYAETEGQEAFYNELNTLCKMINTLNKKTSGKILTDNFTRLSDLFKTPLREVPGHSDVSINGETLNKFLEHELR